MVAQSISLEEAKKDKLFYFVATVIVFRESDGRCLVLKRDEREKVHPGRWGTPGGKLEWNDLPIDKPSRVNGDVLDFEHCFEDLLAREAFEEAGVQIHPELRYIDSVAFIRPDGIPVICGKFAARYKSGDVVLEKGAFTDSAWVNAEEVKKLPCIDGIHEEVARAISLFTT